MMTEKKIVLPEDVPELARSGALIVDVREADEFSEAHVAGALLIPLDQLEARVSEIPKDRAILFICRSGRRSGKAQEVLLDRYGYREVYNVEGGVLAWEKAGLPIVKPAGDVEICSGKSTHDP